MSVYIKGMEMPKEGQILMVFPSGSVQRYFVRDRKQVVEANEAIEVPDHGRLIDANKLKGTLDYYIREAGWGDEINKALGWVKDEFIDSEPTVIPAEPPKEADA